MSNVQRNVSNAATESEMLRQITRESSAIEPPNRRAFLRLAGTGAAGLALGGVIAPIGTPGTPTPACSPKSVNAEVQVAETFLKVVAVELPNQQAFITKILKVTDDFNTDYQRGDFANAGTLFATLSGDFTHLLNDVGVNINAKVKIALVLIDAAIAGIAGLLKSQIPAATQAGLMATLPAAQQSQAAVIEARAAHAEALFTAIKQ
jgi:hypothetical protein